MIFKKIISPNAFYRVKQLESLSKINLFANSCKLPQFGRTSTSLANGKQCVNSGIINNRSNYVAKFPTNVMLGTQISRKATTTTGDHVRMWVLERIVAVALPAVIPAAIYCENAILDGILSVLVVMHTHWGFEAIITDYARPSVVGPVLPKVLHFSLLVLSAVTLCGLFVLINNGPGVSRAIKDAWAIGKQSPSKKSSPAATE
ncbi:PREDICTED: succinate dehydrogenase [ubiquinone] cytochrome b small subunit, mitochondrial [Eufriesea mexicana]|uniref:succinate dehydrogenase [ubiquinone] cytochrome b small subunit, mitochondrial n=1 Tax=Eufriesea mexicana TaxID=516756 RepID=UPI00083C1B34|nr:PREDICTED: succinate dehydrogenase [ubiquinone] cytochrome b small subunit, mitochondrial [Eufriesea mexicana]